MRDSIESSKLCTKSLFPIPYSLFPSAKRYIPTILPVAQQKNVGVIAMKIPAYGKLLEPGRLTGMDQALGYVLSQPGIHSCIVAAEHVTQLEENVKVAQAFQSLSLEKLEAIEKLTAETWQETTFFRRWT
ncbi:MAG: hypothetical protein J7545_16090 [Roseofilum sp. SBFL]|nr:MULTISPECIES: hypothetical protein [unclassified Roseofilum]MBP0015107.1 hypothetical protein [Roseofilum sp. SID3]MBP0023872.1 hypothetical protein [Roseofilum sp. SID2]MBP0039311.1 hypothetical protein [Roseofilum sp. SID1]MBP0043467.1 hypothetical protein [Roseofilum sp. SBFL]